MSFPSITISDKKRIDTGQNCTTATCGCSTCPVKDFCKGPNKSCDAKFCSTRVRDPIGCLSCRAVCNKNPVKQIVVDSVGGADFSDIPWTSFEYDLPDVLFQINSLVYYRKMPAYVINSKKLTYTDTFNWSPQKNIKNRFKIPLTSKIVLSFATSDGWMDFYSRNLKTLALEIKKFSFDYVFGPDFSVYDNYPRFDTIINMKRRVLATRYLEEQGIKVIPTLGWIREEDLKRMLDWALKVSLKCALINFQTVSLPADNSAWEKKLEDLRIIKATLPNCQFFVVGASAENRLRSLMSVLGKVKLVDTKAYRLAEFHKDYEEVVQSKDIKVMDLFENNAKQLIDRYNSISGEL